MRRNRQEGTEPLYTIRKIRYFIFPAIILYLCAGLFAASSEKGKSYSLFYESRGEYGILDKNEDRDVVFRAIDSGIKFSKDIISRPKFNISLADEFDFFAMGLTDYGIDKYDFHLLFNTFDLFSKATISESTSMDVLYEYEIFKDYINPYDENFVNLSNYIVDDVFMHRLNDSRLFYTFSKGTFDIHKKFNILEEDILFEYIKHKATFNFQHYIDSLKKFSVYGEYIDKDFKFSGIDDFTSGFAKISYVQHFVPLKELKKEYESNKKKDYESIGESSREQIDMYDFKVYRRLFDIDAPPPPQVEYNTLELSYEGRLRNQPENEYGDYYSNTLAGSFSTYMDNKLNMTIYDRFTFQDYSPEGRYYENNRTNDLGYRVSGELGKKTTCSSTGFYRFKNNIHFTDEDYYLSYIDLNFYYFLNDKVTFSVLPSITSLNFDVDDATHYDYTNYVFALLTEIRLHQYAQLNIGYEFQRFAYDAADEEYSNFNTKTWSVNILTSPPILNKYSIKGVNSNSQLEMGIKYENLDFDQDESRSERSYFTYIAMRTKLF